MQTGSLSGAGGTLSVWVDLTHGFLATALSPFFELTTPGALYAANEIVAWLCWDSPIRGVRVTNPVINGFSDDWIGSVMYSAFDGAYMPLTCSCNVAGLVGDCAETCSHSAGAMWEGSTDNMVVSQSVSFPAGVPTGCYGGASGHMCNLFMPYWGVPQGIRIVTGTTSLSPGYLTVSLTMHNEDAQLVASAWQYSGSTVVDYCFARAPSVCSGSVCAGSTDGISGLTLTSQACGGGLCDVQPYTWEGSVTLSERPDSNHRGVLRRAAAARRTPLFLARR